MPSRRHEILVELFRQRPELVPALLALVDPALVPGGADTVYVPASGEIAGLHHEQYRADLVVRCMDPGRIRPVHAFVIEVQLARDADKDLTWPMYAANVRVRDRCPVTLVVLTLRERTARWAAAPRLLRIGGPAVIAPVVIGPAQIPRITDLEQARALPELAVLSAAAHGRTPGAELIAHTAIAACAALDSAHQALYADFVMGCLSPEARHALEGIMPHQRFLPLSDIGKRFYAEGRRDARKEARKETREVRKEARKQGRDEGRKEGRKEGWKEGRNEGRNEGWKEGRNEGARALLTRQLTRRFGPLPEAAMNRLQAAGPEQLECWGECLLSAGSLDDVFSGVT